MDDKNFIKENFKAARIALKHTQQSLADAGKFRQNDISRIEGGKISPQFHHIQYLYICGINLNWFFSGEGEMFRRDINLSPKYFVSEGKVEYQKPDKDELIATQRELIAMLKKQLAAYEEAAKEKKKAA